MIFIQVIAWILAFYGLIGMVVAAATKTQRNGGIKLPGRWFALPIGLVGGILMAMITLIEPAEVGVLMTPNGVSKDELHTGWHMVAPWNNVEKLDKTVYVYTFALSSKEGAKAQSDAIWSPTSDGFKLGYDVSVTWRIDPNEASWIYKNLRGDIDGDTARYNWIEENIVRAYTKGAVTTVTKDYNVIEGYSIKRDSIEKRVFQMLQKEFAFKKLECMSVNIREVHYNKEYETAINNKKLAEQEALRQVEVTKTKKEQEIQATIDKNISITKSQGEAEALRIKGAAINQNPKVVELNLIEKWDGKLPSTLITTGQNNSMLLNVATGGR